MRNRRYSDLKREELFQIYNMFKSGKFYEKEICAKFRISIYTFNKVIQVVDDMREAIKDTELNHLMEKRREAHKWFDKLWRNHKERDEYYIKLAEALGITQEQCHFSLMDNDTLDKAITIIKKWWLEKFDR